MSMKEKTNPLHNTIVVTRAILTLIAEEMKRQGVERVEDLKPTERGQEENELRRAEIRELIEDEPIKPIVPQCVSAQGYESGLAASMTEEQKNCPYCDEEMLDNEIGGEPIPEFGKGYAIEHGDIKAFIEKKAGKYYLSHNFTPNSSDFFLKMEIKLCPMCGRKLEA